MFFCLGNICRSPLGEALFRQQVETRGYGDLFEIASSGTSAYHVGELPDPGSREVARRRADLDISDQRSQQLTSGHLERYDYLVAMSHSNLANARQLDHASSANFLLLRDFEPLERDRDRDVPDPWGRGRDAFDEVYDIVERCCERLLDQIEREQGL